MLIISLFRFILGLIFLVTGISKIPIFDAFAYSITELVPLSGTVLTMTAVAAIVFEIVVGLALVFNKITRLFSGLLALMIITFIILLSSALFRYESYICTCFGVLGLKLPVMEQIFVDKILLVMTLIVFFYSESESRMLSSLRRYAPKVIFSVVVISIIWSGLIITQPRMIFGEKPELNVNAQLVFDEIPNRSTLDPRLVFMIDMADFLCPDCVADFLGMADRITEKSQKITENVFILVKQVDFMETEEQRQYIDDWKSAHNFPLHMSIDTNELFTRAGFDKSAALLFTGLGSLEDAETFPMGSRRRNEVLDRFLRPFGV